jgi:hypothetical protein
MKKKRKIIIYKKQIYSTKLIIKNQNQRKILNKVKTAKVRYSLKVKAQNKAFHIQYNLIMFF